MPICEAIKKGDIASFWALTDVQHPYAPWFLKWRVLLQIRNRGEVLVWRSLVRKLYLLTRKEVRGQFPSIELSDLRILARYLEGKATIEMEALDGSKHSSLFFPSIEISETECVDPDFDGAYLHTPPEEPGPSAVEIESLTASLVDQGLLHGFVSHKFQRFLVTGSKGGDALKIGFPPVWRVMTAKDTELGEVPGWVKEGGKITNGGGGRVIRLSGIKGVAE